MNSNNNTAASQTVTVELALSELKSLAAALEMRAINKAMAHPKAASIQKDNALVARLNKIIKG
jgi:hypothetical protein